jgi:hypothetical protein
MQPASETPSDVSVVVEQDGPQKFKIQSGQLEQIGRQLRGRRRFSIFNSIVLPALVTVLTTILTGTFQYLSWINTVRLQAASAVAERAAAAYEQSAALIGERIYGTEVFIPTVRDLAQTLPIKQVPAAAAPTVPPTNAGGIQLSSHQSAAPEMTIPLTTISAALLKRRYDTYYAQLKQWKERYDQLLTDIDYDLDRPIFVDAKIGKPVTIHAKDLQKINCDGGLIDPIRSAGLDAHSLKMQFAVLNHCFARLHASYELQLNKVLQHEANVLDPESIKLANERLDNLRGSANEFRCVALLRIDYYKAQKEKSIFIPPFIRRLLFNPLKTDAERHFKRADEACDPEYGRT